MDELLKAHEKLEGDANLGRSIGSVEQLIQKLKSAREHVAADPGAAPAVMAKLQSPVAKGLDDINSDLKQVYKGLGQYSKALDKKFQNKPLPFVDNDPLVEHGVLINRAIAMHLLREGHFDVAATFISEANANPPPAISVPLVPSTAASSANLDAMDVDASSQLSARSAASLQVPSAASPLSAGPSLSTTLRHQFSEMYHILDELRNHSNLQPAIDWARAHSGALEARGSNLEYELCRLQYVSLFVGSTAAGAGPLAAIDYARRTFPRFPARYHTQTQALMGALAYAQDLRSSPYGHLFAASLPDAERDRNADTQQTASTEDVPMTDSPSTSQPASAPAQAAPANPRPAQRTPLSSPLAFSSPGVSATTASAAAAFTSEFCSLLSLSSSSPLLTSINAGCIALPTLQKLSQIQTQHRTSWTTAAELPVEIPLPPQYSFHSVFVCPVSKEQSTDKNPPMMLPCGHVVAKESLDRLSKGVRFKCPYCPVESQPKDARMVFL